MEIWDTYTRDGRLTEVRIVRERDTIPDGLYHLVCEVLVRHTDGSILCMRRALSKTVFPGYYEATAGGSALSGEGPLDCIQRELREETGIACNTFTEVGFCVRESSHALFYSYVCTVDVAKDSVRVQEGETEDYVWMTPEEFAAFIRSDGVIPTQKERYRAYWIAEGILVS